MPKLVLKQIARLALLLIAVSVVVFALVSLSPIDPVQANVGQAAYLNMTPEKRAALADYWGVNTPIWERYLNWAGAFLRGDMGTSLRFNAPVAQVVATRAANTLLLMLVAWIVSGVLGFALGVLAAMRRGSWVDKLVKGYCFILAATPTFWIGLVFLFVPVFFFNWKRQGD